MWQWEKLAYNILIIIYQKSNGVHILKGHLL